MNADARRSAAVLASASRGSTTAFVAVWFATAGAALVPVGGLSAQMTRAPGADVAAIADRVFAPWNSTRGPGCVVGIDRAGKTLLTRGYGMADLTSERPLSATSILESGSVAKQFTAMAVMLLMQDGKVALDADVRSYLPEFPQYSKPITVRHLLSHTSGLREWSNLVALQGWPRGTRMHTQDVVYDLITKQQSLNYSVGDYYSYTNSGFLVLRTLIERVSGTPFAQFTAERMFAPLGMSLTRWREDYTTVVPGLAQAYRRAGDGWHLDMPFDNIIGAGGMFTTVGDWLTWNRALTARTLGAAVTDSMTRQMRLTSGREIQYAMGLTVSQYRGTKQIAHSGSTAGYSTYLARYPEQDDLSIAVMCNASGAPATAYAHALVDAMVPTLLTQSGPITIEVPEAELRKYAGVYRDTRTNTISELAASQGTLRRDGTPLLPLQGGAFQVGAGQLRFALDARGRRTMGQPTTDGDTVMFVREALARWVPSAADLAPFAGRYYNDEIDAWYTVSVVKDSLHVFMRPGAEGNWQPAFRDAFRDDGESVWFTRDKKGRVTAMHFGSGRAWDVVAKRVP